MTVPAGGDAPLDAPQHAWWSQRFLGLLESFGLGSRLERGREYVQTGRVLELDVEPGIVLAKVQGSRFTPYGVRIRPQTFSEHQWRRAEKTIAARALTLAQLLTGEMPDDIEDVLAAAKLALLPRSYDELRATCTCPDAANPCKHIAAVYYMLAERLDGDPFVLFTLRGRTEGELLHALRARRVKAGGIRPAAAAADAGGTPTSAGSSVRAAAGAPPVRPLAEALDGFWLAGDELDLLQVSPLAGAAPDALLRRAGPLAPDEGGFDLCELLVPAYLRLAAAAERRAVSD